jgi:hypothetical protein
MEGIVLLIRKDRVWQEEKIQGYGGSMLNATVEKENLDSLFWDLQRFFRR